MATIGNKINNSYESEPSTGSGVRLIGVLAVASLLKLCVL